MSHSHFNQKEASRRLDLLHVAGISWIAGYPCVYRYILHSCPLNTVVCCTSNAYYHCSAFRSLGPDAEMKTHLSSFWLLYIIMRSANKWGPYAKDWCLLCSNGRLSREQIIAVGGFRGAIVTPGWQQCRKTSARLLSSWICCFTGLLIESRLTCPPRPGSRWLKDSNSAEDCASALSITMSQRDTTSACADQVSITMILIPGSDRYPCRAID